MNRRRWIGLLLAATQGALGGTLGGGAALAAVEPPVAAQADGSAEQAVGDSRRRPGVQPDLPAPAVQNNVGALRAPPPSAFPTDSLPLPDRWRIMTSLCPAKGGDQTIFEAFKAMREVCHTPRDPYHQNTLKGDRAIDRAKVPWAADPRG